MMRSSVSTTLLSRGGRWMHRSSSLSSSSSLRRLCLPFTTIQSRNHHHNYASSLSSITTSQNPLSATPPPPWLQILDPVRQALNARRPVVALESTIVAHGMPYPDNVELSRDVAALLRERGVEPATIAICNGVCRVGLTSDELEDLASCQTQQHSSGRQQRRGVEKCTTRDVPLLMAEHQRLLKEQQQFTSTSPALWGATTVASTMMLAHRAGIHVFVTGGCGGVHRGVDQTWDISADLTELARTPVIVVSAGIKSILDISKTLQVLETNSVPVVAYQTNDMPAFFSPASSQGLKAPARRDEAADIAAAHLVSRQLGLNHGMLVAVPNREPAGQAVEDAIQQALQEANTRGIEGREVTPFVLKRVAETTHGDSLRSNTSLVKQNAVVGAEIARALAEQQRQHEEEEERAQPQPSTPSPKSGTTTTSSSKDNDTSDRIQPTKVVVMGGIVLDTVAKPTSDLQLHTSNPATCTESDGGVGRNVAEALGRLGSKPLMFSAVGNDLRGRALVDRLSFLGNDDDDNSCGVQVTSTSVPILNGQNTASYVAVLDKDGDLHTAMADMSVLEHIAVPTEREFQEAQAEFLVVDANPPVESLLLAAQRARTCGMQVFLEPTSVPKAAALANHHQHHHADDVLKHIQWVSPNAHELFALVHGRAAETDEERASLEEEGLSGVQNLCEQLLQRMDPSAAAKHILCTLGARGLLYATASESGSSQIHIKHFPVLNGPNQQVLEVANATGAGDSLVGAFLHALTHDDDRSIEEAIEAGMRAATVSLQCADRAVSPHL